MNTNSYSPSSVRRLFRQGLRTFAWAVPGLVLGSMALELTTRLAKAVDFAATTTIDNASRDDPASIVASEDSFRVLVLGDSMAYSPGVPRNLLWSTLLEENLSSPTRPVQVLNAARPGDNTWNQLELLREHIDRFRPHIVLLLYNYNDVYGGRRSVTASAEVVATTTVSSEDNREYKQSLLVRAIRLLQQSTALQLISVRVALQLKVWGIVVPGSELSHLLGPAYQASYPGWIAVQDELAAMQGIAAERGASLGIYVMPTFDTLRYDLFARPRARLDEVLDESGVTHHFGWDDFRGRDWRELAISPFDGHPNLEANAELASSVAEWLEEAGLR